MPTAAYYDFFRKITLQPDGVTLEADSVTDTLTITSGPGVALNPNASTDSFEIDVDYQLYVPIGTTNIALTDVNSNETTVSITGGSNIVVSRISDTELEIIATVGGASKSISNITLTNPVVVTTTNAHSYTEGSEVTITDVVGTTEVNGNEYFMDILTSNTFALYSDRSLTVPVNGSTFTPYVSGGVATADYTSIKTLEGLTDTTITGLAANDGLVYNGSQWINTEVVQPGDNITTSQISSSDSSAITVTTDLVLNSGLTVGHHIIPSSNVNIDLGSATNRFRDLYLSGSTIDLGGVRISRLGDAVRLPAGTVIGDSAPATTSTANAVPVANETGKLDATWLPTLNQDAFYVSVDGVDDAQRDGKRPEQAWASIRYALTHITGPATLHVLAGVYEEQLPLRVPANVSVVGSSQRTVEIRPAAGLDDTGTKNNNQSTMWMLRDGTLLKGLRFTGMTGFTTGVDTTDVAGFTANGVYVSLDPTSPITSKSPYVLECTAQSSTGIGVMVDGDVHASGNKSILVHAYTCILDDGIGYWANGEGKLEIVSGFTYYCHIGYLTSNGGKIRSLNGNNSYGTYGALSVGFNSAETAITGTLYGEQLEWVEGSADGTFNVGDTITGQTSLATGTVTGVQASSSKLYYKLTSGTFQNDEVISNGTASATLTSTGVTGQKGFILIVNNLSALPKIGSSIQLTGDSSSYVVRAVSGTYIDASSVITLLLADEKASASADGTAFEIRREFSQVRLTGHDFLNVGTGNFVNTNYPGIPLISPSQANEVIEQRPGRVYYVSTDQDGNLRIGEFFRVDQSTGIATLNASAFDLSGLNSLRLGAVGAQLGELINEFSSDFTLAASSNQKVPTENAVKNYFTVTSTDIKPSITNTYDLGSLTKQYKDIYISGDVFGKLTGDVTGSVFADDSTVMVDSVTGTINLSNNTTDDISEGSTNLYYTDARAQSATTGRSIAMSLIFGG